MKFRRISAAILIAVALAGTCSSLSIAAQSGQTSPVAARRENVEKVVAEAYEKFKG